VVVDTFACPSRFEIVILSTPLNTGYLPLCVEIYEDEHSVDHSTNYINCHALIEQLKKAHFENHLPDRLKALYRFKILIIDENGYLPMDIQGANLFFQLIAKRYEKNSTIFTSNRAFSQWNEVFSDVTIASAILDRVLHHCTVINIKGESYRLKERKELMKHKQQIADTLFVEPHP
jgi:DNA replication protein DnaC